MTSIASKPFPQYEGLVDLASMMLRDKPAHPNRSQMHAMNDLPTIVIEDWDKLFHAVQIRLCSSIAPTDPLDDKTRLTVLECVEALEQLHAALTLERQQRHWPD